MAFPQLLGGKKNQTHTQLKQVHADARRTQNFLATKHRRDVWLTMGVSIQQRNLERFKQLRPISFRLSSEAEHFEAVQIFIFHGSVRKRNHTDAKKGGGHNPILVILKPQHGTLEWIDPIGNEQHSRHQQKPAWSKTLSEMVLAIRNH